MAGNPNKRVEQRFWEKVEWSIEGCWLWKGALCGGGYGHFQTIPGKYERAHRFMLMLTGQVIPDDMQVDHLCRVRNCVRPDHLEIVTPTENLRRGESPIGKNHLKTHCPQGHEYNEANTIVSAKGQRKCRACAAARPSARRPGSKLWDEWIASRLKHGTAHRYRQHKCRCEPCTAAYAEYRAISNARQRAKRAANAEKVRA